jgi:hypothetical protein
MKGRRIILLLDGTWNDADLGPTDTNISRLRDIMAEATGAGLASSPLRPEVVSDPGSMVTGTSTNNAENIVFYSRGVGTASWANQVFGGALGAGLDTNIRRAYRFLSFHYRPGDEIFIFGFSRGSYTARSLVGYIAAAGLLRSNKCSEDNERFAWDFYRSSPGERPPGEWHRLQPLMHDGDRLRIDCLAVFDTVGSLGIPLEAFVRSNREHYEFHDVELPSITRVNLQALAIDENRWPFQATVWRPSPFRKINTVTEQVWFSGGHPDIGGGYFRSTETNANHYRADDITLDWLLRRLRFFFKDFPVPDRWIKSAAPDNWSESGIHNSRQGVYRLYPKSWRAISNREVGSLGTYEIAVGVDRHSKSLNEMVHISAIERLWTRNGSDGTPYAPKNLISILPTIESTYRTQPANEQVLLVDWNGEVLDPVHFVQCACAKAALDNAIQRKKRFL